MFVLGEQDPRPLGEISYLDVVDWRRLNTSFVDMAAMGPSNWNGELAGRGEPITVAYRAVSGSWFDVLGMRAALGRTLNPADDRPDSAPAVVISHGLWERIFGADRTALGGTIALNDGAYTIVGVMPRGFQYPDGADLWMPLVAEGRRPGVRRFLESRDLGFLFAVGRLKPGVSAERARLELDTIIAQLAAEHDRKTEGRAALVPLVDGIFGTARPALWALFAGAGLVLFIAWANVIGLLLARSVDRGRDLAICVALGASRHSLVAGVAAESALLAAIGTLAGLGLSALAFPMVLRLAPDVPRLGDARTADMTAALFAFALAVVTGVACGLIPARHMVRDDVAASLASGSTRSGPGVGRRRLRRLIVGLPVEPESRVEPDRSGPRLDVYVPLRQARSSTSDVMVRTSGDPALLIPPIRALVREMDAQQIVTFEIMDDAVDEATRPWRFNFLLFGVLAAVGTVMAAAGLYGVLSRGVAERAREIGIRKALGATDAGIARLIGLESSAFLVAGLTLGTVGALGIVPALRSLLFGVQPTNAGAFALAGALVALVAMVATATPVYRACRIDPARLLRSG